jgi:hypothetical protein
MISLSQVWLLQESFAGAPMLAQASMGWYFTPLP